MAGTNVPKYPAVSEPTTDGASLRESVLNLKEGVEMLTRQRGDPIASAVTWADLSRWGLLTLPTYPKS